MTDSFVFKLFKNIIDASTVLQGRFVVLDTAPGDINTSNFGQLVVDALGGQVSARKYPAAIAVPAIDIDINPSKDYWQTQRHNLIFLTLDQRTGTGDHRDYNPGLGISTRYPKQDWEEMMAEAKQFVRVLDRVTRTKTANQVHLKSDQQIVYSRFAHYGSERVNGVRVAFDVRIHQACELTSYQNVDDIQIPVL